MNSCVNNEQGLLRWSEKKKQIASEGGRGRNHREAASRQLLEGLIEIKGGARQLARSLSKNGERRERRHWPNARLPLRL